MQTGSPFRGGIGVKMLTLLLLVFLPLFIYHLTLLKSELDNADKFQKEECLRQARVVKSVLESYLDTLWSSESSLGQVIKDIGMDMDKAELFMQTFVRDNNVVSRISILNPLGFVIGSTYAGSRGIYIGDRGHIRSILGGDEASASDLVRSRTTGRIALMIAKAIRINSELLGIMTLELDPDKIGLIMEPLLDSRYNVALVDSGNRVIYTTTNTRIGTVFSIPKGLGRSVAIRGTKWRIWSYVPDNLSSELPGNLFWPLLTTFLITLISGMGAFFLGRSLLRKIAVLDKVASRASIGDFQITTELTGSDQLDRAGRAIDNLIRFVNAMLDNIDAAIVLLSYPEKRFIISNKQHEELYSDISGKKYSHDDFWGKSITDIYSTQSNELLDSIDSACETGESIRMSPRRLVSFEGRPIYIEGVITPIKDDAGAVTHVMVLGVNVTELVRTQRDLEAVIRDKDQLLSMASHELKTPLTILMSNAELISMMYDDLTPEKRQRFLANFTTQCKKLNRLVNDLLDFSRLSNGHLNVVMQEADLSDLVNEVVEEQKAICKTHDVVLDSVVKSIVKIDYQRIEQVVSNLITNGVRYSPPGSRVSIIMDKDTDWVYVSVKDHGVGIAVEDLPKLFDPYYRSLTAKGTVPSGLGLGLYVAREIISLHGGDILVDSIPGSGSTFTIKLPVINVPSETKTA